jgi:hypothetical protein
MLLNMMTDMVEEACAVGYYWTVSRPAPAPHSRHATYSKRAAGRVTGSDGAKVTDGRRIPPSATGRNFTTYMPIGFRKRGTVCR